MTVLKTEIKLVAAVLEEADDVAEKAIEAGEDPPTIEYVATQIIETLDEHRDKKPTFTIVARFTADGGKTWNFFTYGWFKSEAVARQKASGLFPPGTVLNVKWMIFQNVKNFRKEVLPSFKGEDEQSAWVDGQVPVELIRYTTWAEPISPEEE